MAVGNAPAYGQPDTGPFKFVPAMQPLENSKDLFGVLLFETNSVILDPQFAKLIGGRRLAPAAEIALKNLRTDFDDRLRVRRLKLERVANEILQQLPHLKRICVYGGQIADFDF